MQAGQHTRQHGHATSLLVRRHPLIRCHGHSQVASTRSNNYYYYTFNVQGRRSKQRKRVLVPSQQQHALVS